MNLQNAVVAGGPISNQDDKFRKMKPAKKVNTLNTLLNFTPIVQKQRTGSIPSMGRDGREGGGDGGNLGQLRGSGRAGEVLPLIDSDERNEERDLQTSQIKEIQIKNKDEENEN